MVDSEGERGRCGSKREAGGKARRTEEEAEKVKGRLGTVPSPSEVRQEEEEEEEAAGRANGRESINA